MSKPGDENSGEKLCGTWDRCQLDAAFKTTGGLVLGALASLMLFRLSRWPIIFGAGLGLGLAYVNCEQDINKTLKEAQEKKQEHHGVLKEEEQKPEQKQEEKK